MHARCLSCNTNTRGADRQHERRRNHCKTPAAHLVKQHRVVDLLLHLTLRPFLQAKIPGVSSSRLKQAATQPCKHPTSRAITFFLPLLLEAAAAALASFVCCSFGAYSAAHTFIKSQRSSSVAGKTCPAALLTMLGDAVADPSATPNHGKRTFPLGSGA